MRKSRLTEAQIAMALRQGEAGTAVEEICRKLGISEGTYFRWKQKYGSLGVPELRELRQLRDENRKLKGLVADLSLDQTILHDALRKQWQGRRSDASSCRGRWSRTGSRSAKHAELLERKDPRFGTVASGRTRKSCDDGSGRLLRCEPGLGIRRSTRCCVERGGP
jgi:putative transposase